MSKECCKMIIELHQNSLVSVLNNKTIDAQLFTNALNMINYAIDRAIIANDSITELEELKDYISILKYDILMKYGKY